ncbi:acyltransferase family protein [Ornithinimicrobium cryptoxanthini]|uniref:Acyltransferase n=1 Tax=Ornithinimicrobium cryptoxanthini TaxID=2934161 RepID=A0ABY4YJ14_9MICO|nr:acyltransferase family protein [Ornithinimicrobium cryptoxanthini]USQ76323.1 acyltransferase [Ornithinimicrobium cryptoxanthini]
MRTTPGGSRFRGDVEGLRAIAVLLVLVYHAGVVSVSGGFVGVDVFFVVSGFVITNQLLREVESTGRLSLMGFYGRRAKRLLPAAGLVLVVTTIGSWLLTSRVQWQQIGGDIVGAAVYVVNWVFAARSVDYLAEDVEPSPVLHYWSLAVEEQFYLIWPVIILVLLAVLRRRAHRAAGRQGLPAGQIVVPQRRQLAIGLLAMIVLPSLVFSVVYTALRPSEAFFITPTRLWELGAGALVALGAGAWTRWSPGWGAALAWTGVVAVVASGFLVDTSTPWPGYAALLPVLGTAAVIVGGFTHTRWSPSVLLGTAPMVWIGGLSYSLYLWHWPLLRFWEWQFGAPSVPIGLLVVAASVVPSWLSYRWVESPIRHARALNVKPRYALSVGFNFTLVSLVAGLLLTGAATAQNAGTGRATGAGWTTDRSASTDNSAATGVPDDSAASTQGPGGQAVGLPLPEAEQAGDEPFFDTLTPDPLDAVRDVPSIYDAGCQLDAEDTTSSPCESGDPDGSVVVAVVGDSKVAQWLPAIDAIAEENGWLVRSYTKSGCPFADSMQITAEGAEYTTCRDWGRDVLERLTGPERPAAIITSSVMSRGLPGDAADPDDASREGLTDGYVRYWSALEDAGVQVIALSDTPQPGDVAPVYACVDDHRDDPSVCSWDLATSAGSTVLQAAVDEVDGAQFVDMDPWVCPGGRCVGVYRNVLTYRQGSHITGTFAQVLTEPLAAYLVPLVEHAGD